MITTADTGFNRVSHTHIGQELRRRILTSQYGPGQRIPPERELLEEFGCSRLTVAKAMAPLVADGLIERHRGRGTFVAQAAGEERASGRSDGRPATRGNVVKYVSPGTEQNVRSSRDDVLAALHGSLDDVGYHVSVDFYGDLEQHVRCLSKIHDPQIAGVVLWPMPDASTVEAVSKLVADAVPLVLIDTYLPEIDCDYVVTDNIEGAALMVGHLARLGHRRIAYVTPPTTRTSLRDRLAGFLRGMIEAHLPVDSDSVVSIDPAGDPANTLDRILSLSTPPTALFAAHDSIALALLPLLRERGLAVPEDITLVGFDGLEAGEFSSVPLTTVKQDFRQMADIAARILLERFDGRTAPLRYHRLIEPQLIVRASCAPPAAVRAAYGSRVGGMTQDWRRSEVYVDSETSKQQAVQGVAP